MVKFAEADARLFKSVFVCRHCKTKMKALNMKVMASQINCRKCGARYLRPIKKK